jgi:antitoxin CptB
MAADAPEVAPMEHRRLLWRCRRGTRELDVLLERFVRQHYVSAPAAHRRAFERLVGLPDPELADYLFGYATPDRALADIAARVAGRQVPSISPIPLDVSDNC